jgi:hypothetical protein
MRDMLIARPLHAVVGRRVEMKILSNEQSSTPNHHK